MSTALFERLREERNKIAQRRGVAPYMILHNDTLKEIAAVKPQNHKQLLKINGIGDKKIERYGSEILKVLKDFTGQPGTLVLNEKKIFQVGEFITELNQLFHAQVVTVQGEVGEVKNRGNYTFFSLLDSESEEKAKMECFAWNENLTSLNVPLEQGMAVKVLGYPNVYKPSGRFSFRIQQISLIGEGALKAALDALKKKLKDQGYFAAERKKSVPDYSKRIGLITSRQADAKADFLKHLGHYGFSIYFYDVRVEGFSAVDDIISALSWFNQSRLDLDVLALTRGGGSLESLQAFNSEEVAKAIHASKTPVVTGVGHERDTTIADLVSDQTASTPTDAARIISDPWRQAGLQLTGYERNIISRLHTVLQNNAKDLKSEEDILSSAIKVVVEGQRQILDNQQDILAHFLQGLIDSIYRIEEKLMDNLRGLSTILSNKKSELRESRETLLINSRQWLQGLHKDLDSRYDSLQIQDPLARLEQGYSVVRNSAGQIIKQTSQIEVADTLDINFHKGQARTRVEEVKQDG